MSVDIRSERLNRGLSMKDAARLMGLRDWKTLQRAEAGAVPQPANAFKIASFYGHLVTEVWPLDVAA